MTLPKTPDPTASPDKHSACPNSPNGKHEWVEGPNGEKYCKHCYHYTW